MRFTDKVVLVVGGNSGIGLASAQAFAAEGGIVHLTGRDQATIDSAVASIAGATTSPRPSGRSSTTCSSRRWRACRCLATLLHTIARWVRRFISMLRTCRCTRCLVAFSRLCRLAVALKHPQPDISQPFEVLFQHRHRDAGIVDLLDCIFELTVRKRHQWCPRSLFFVDFECSVGRGLHVVLGWLVEQGRIQVKCTRWVAVVPCMGTCTFYSH